MTKHLKKIWIDGFLPETVKNTQHGADVEGTAWVGEGPSIQHPYRFVVSAPQKLLSDGQRKIFIGQIHLDEKQQTLQIELADRKLVE
jgi:hypothetical protein